MKGSEGRTVCFRPHRLAEAGLDDSGGHAVHSDVALSQLGGQCPGQTQQRRLAHAVGTQRLQRHSVHNTHKHTHARCRKCFGLYKDNKTRTIFLSLYHNLSYIVNIKFEFLLRYYNMPLLMNRSLFLHHARMFFMYVCTKNLLAGGFNQLINFSMLQYSFLSCVDINSV